MIHPTFPDIENELEQFDAEIAKSYPSISVGEINVQGNVEGSIVVGNHNVIGNNNVIYQINNKYGAFVNLCTPPPISKRAVSPLPPRLPRGFIGREQELKALGGYIRNKEPVLIYGHSGMGKTALLQKVANSEAAKSMPDGVLYLEASSEGNILGLQDIQQRAFDKLFESNPPTKLTDSIVEANLATTSPLVILDEWGFNQGTLGWLPGLFPAGAILVTNQIDLFDDGFESIQLAPLSHEEAIQLFAEKSGIAAHESARQIIDQICRILQDVPLAITTIANAIRQNRLQLSTVVDGLTSLQPPSRDNLQAAIERSFGLLYLNLSGQERDMLAIVAAAPGKSVNREWLESLEDGKSTCQSLEALEVLYANSPRLRLPEGMRPIIQSGRTGLDARREFLARQLINELKRDDHYLDPNFVADELGNILGLFSWAYTEQRWDDVIELGRAVDPYLTLQGLWETWGYVLAQVQAAGQNIKEDALRNSVEGWVLHQLGTREIGFGSDRNQAINLLKQALEIRIKNGDISGAKYTLHNLRLILALEPPEPPEPPDDPTGPPIRPTDPTLIVREYLKQLWPFITKNAVIIVAMLIGLAAVSVVSAQPSLKLTEQANPAKYNHIGQVIEYRYIVDNPGFKPVPGPISVTDDKMEIKCPDLRDIGNENNSLDWNEMITCTGFYVITEDDIQNGSISNKPIASVTSDNQQSRFPSKPESITIPFDTKYLTLALEAEPSTYANPGQTITVAYIVKNVGTATLSGPLTISDDQMHVHCPDLPKTGNPEGILSVGESLTCIATYTVTEVDIKNGSIKNTVRANAGEIDSEPQSLTIYGIPQSGLTLSASADRPTYKAIGEEITYTYSITYQGNEPITGPVNVTADLMDLPCPKVTEIGNGDNWLNPGEILTCKATYVINQADIDRRSAMNNISASAGGITAEPQSVTVFFEAPPPTLFKSADRETYHAAGEEVTYSYIVMNQGSVPVSDPVIVKDNMAEVKCPDINQAGDQKDPLDPGPSITCTATYTITDADIKNGSVTNTAVAYIGDRNSEPQSVTIYFNIEPSNLTLSQWAEPETYQEAGQQIHYTYVIQNDGKYPLKGPLTLRDDKARVNCPEINTSGDGDGALDPGERLVCSAVYTITDFDIQNGSVTNMARASMDGVDSNPASTTLNEKILLLKLTTDHQTYEVASETITYNYEIIDHSMEPLAGPVIVTDDKLRVNCPDVKEVGNGDGFLDWNETINCTSQYLVTQANIDVAQPDSDHGAVTNTAWANVGGINSKEATVTIVGPIQKRALSLVMTADPPNFSDLDQKITYTYVITNEGNVTILSPFQVTDDHVDNGTPFNCGADHQQIAPKASVTCTGNYIITQDNFGPKSVTNTATASFVYLEQPIASTAINTITCQYATGWIPYTVEVDESLAHISTWYPNFSEADLRKANCMGSSSNIQTGQTFYVPNPPPLATISGFIRDTTGQPLGNTAMTLTNPGNGSSITTYTGAYGEYTFLGLEPGTYKIFQVLIQVRRGDTKTQNFTIIPGTP